MWPYAVISIGPGEEVCDAKEAVDNFRAWSEPSVRADDHGHDAEAACADGNHIVGSWRGFARHAGVRLVCFPVVAEGCLLHHRQQFVVRHGMSARSNRVRQGRLTERGGAGGDFVRRGGVGVAEIIGEPIDPIALNADRSEWLSLDGAVDDELSDGRVGWRLPFEVDVALVAFGFEAGWHGRRVRLAGGAVFDTDVVDVQLVRLAVAGSLRENNGREAMRIERVQRCLRKFCQRDSHAGPLVRLQIVGKVCHRKRGCVVIAGPLQRDFGEVCCLHSIFCVEPQEESVAGEVYDPIAPDVEVEFGVPAAIWHRLPLEIERVWPADEGRGLNGNFIIDERKRAGSGYISLAVEVRLRGEAVFKEDLLREVLVGKCEGGAANSEQERQEKCCPRSNSAKTKVHVLSSTGQSRKGESATTETAQRVGG